MTLRRSCPLSRSGVQVRSGRCASDEDELHPGLGSLLESLIGGLAVEAAVGPVVVVEVLPLAELVVEHLGVVDHDPLEQAVELLGVDAVGPFDLAVEPWGAGLDVDVAGASVQDVPVEAGAELGPVVGLDDGCRSDAGGR